MKKIILIVITVCFGISAKGQYLDFPAKVMDAQCDGISGATIYLLNTGFHTVTDEQGKFIIQHIPSGTYDIQVSAVGYATNTREIVLNSAAPISIRLTEENKQLNEVVVTAQKREENVQEIPFSISVLSAKQVHDYRLSDNKELTAIIPNLYSANPGDNRNVTSIRGIATTSYDQTVATYIDGVSQFGLDTYISGLQDVERIEVLRGPQGTLYGRNAMGGVINIITKQPDNKLRGFAGISLGNYGKQRYNVGLRAPLIANKLFMGVSGLYTKMDGYYTNLFNDSSFDKQHTFMGNYYLKFLANSRLSFTLNVKHNENRNRGTFPLASSIEQALEDPFKVNQNTVTEMVDHVFNSSLSANYYTEDFNFTSQTAYQSNHRYYKEPIDADFSPGDFASIINNYGDKWNNVKVGTQEFRLTSPASLKSPWKWVGGSYLYYRNNPVKQGILMGDITQISTNIGHDFGLAFFGDVTYTILPKLDLSVGLRYDYEHKELSIKGEELIDGETVVNQVDTSSSAAFNAFSPKASLAYHLTEDNHVYATYNRGFRSGGITQYSATDPGSPPLYPYQAEYSNNIEIGSKNTFLDKRLRMNVSAFYTLVTDAQVPTLVLPDAITITRNAGKLTSKGIELELASTPLTNLEVAYNIGYTHARYTDLNVASNETAVNLKGNHQVFTPDITSLLSLQYGYDISKRKKVRLTVRGEWKYLGKQYFDLANQLEQEEYSLFNLRAGIAIPRVELFIWAENVSDKAYVDYAYEGIGAAHLGNPKTYGISIMTKF